MIHRALRCIRDRLGSKTASTFVLLLLLSAAMQLEDAIAQQSLTSTSSRSTSAPLPPAEDIRNIAAYIGTRPIYVEEIDTVAQSQLLELLEQMYRLRRAVLEKEIDRLLIEQEAKARGVAISVVQRDLTNTRAITDTEVDQAYEKAKARFATMPEIEAKDRIRRLMQQGEQRRSYQETMVKMRQAAGVEVVLKRPAIPSPDFARLHGPTLGAREPKVRIVVFSDYECPYCRAGETQISQMLEKYATNVQVVYKQFPLPSHKQAQKAAEAALCASEQGRFHIVHDALFAHSKDLSSDRLFDIAAQAELDVEEFGRCLNSGKMAPTVARDKEQGESIGVRATPTFLINGEIFRGLPSPGELETVIQQVLDGRKAPAN
jgi:protein-disulfide isomerase